MIGLTDFRIEVARLFFMLVSLRPLPECAFSYYDDEMEVHRSASKHGVSNDDVLHAVEHEMVSFDLEPDAHPPNVLMIGPDAPGTCSR